MNETFEESEVQAVLDGLVGERDPEETSESRLAHVTSRMNLLLEVVGRLADERATTAAHLASEGATLEQIGAPLGVTRQTAHRLVQRGREITSRYNSLPF